MEITLVGFELVGFSQDFCQRLLPSRVGFLLENWYRLARQAISDNEGILDRYCGDRVTAVFGYQQHHSDHVQCALRAAQALNQALAAFNRAYDLDLRLRAGITCGLALLGRIRGDHAPLSIQGKVQGDMAALTKTKLVGAPIRLNRAAYRRVSGIAEFIEFDEPRVGTAWATYLHPE
jgi:class 3 adenylate cyclase